MAPTAAIVSLKAWIKHPSESCQTPEVTQQRKLTRKVFLFFLFLVVISHDAVQNFIVLVFDIMKQPQHHWFLSSPPPPFVNCFKRFLINWTHNLNSEEITYNCGKVFSTIWMEYVFSAQQPGWNQTLSQLRPRNILQRFALTTSVFILPHHWEGF